MIGKKSAKPLTKLLSGPKGFGSLLGALENRRTLGYTLKGLLDEGLIEKRGKGYGLTEKGREIATRIAEISRLLDSKSPDVERIPHPIYRDMLRRYCNLLLEHLGDRLESLVLFGSVARGDWDKASDLDLLVVARGFEDPMKALDELIKAELELELTSEHKLALERGFYPTFQHYPLTPEEIFGFPRILLDAVWDGICIYDKGVFNLAAEKLKRRLSETGSHKVELPDGSWYWVLGAEEI